MMEVGGPKLVRVVETFTVEVPEQLFKNIGHYAFRNRDYDFVRKLTWAPYKMARAIEETGATNVSFSSNPCTIRYRIADDCGHHSEVVHDLIRRIIETVLRNEPIDDNLQEELNAK